MNLTGNQDFISASKTLVTVGLSFLACIGFLHNPISIYFALYTATCCSLMQAGNNKMEHLKSMLLAGLAFVLFVSLGLAVKNIIWLKNLSLIFFAFMAFYLPNLGFKYKMPPVFGVIFYVCVLNMPTPEDPAQLIVLANALAAGIAILVYFLLWPYRAEHELTLISCNLIDEYRKMIHQFRQALFSAHPKQRHGYLHKILDHEKGLESLLSTFNDLTHHPTLEGEDQAYFREFYMQFYGTLQMIKMMCSTMNDFPKTPISAQLLKDLGHTLKEIETDFNRRLPHSLISKLIPPLSRGHKPLSLAEYDELLSQLVNEKIADAPEGQFAYALLRLKESYTEMKSRLEHWQLKRARGLFI